VRARMERAHHDCFIANSVNAVITIEPEILHADGRPELKLI